jgi:hypothetical protein
MVPQMHQISSSTIAAETEDELVFEAVLARGSYFVSDKTSFTSGAGAMAT